MDFSIATNTVFAFLVRNLEFDFSLPKAVAFLAVTVGACSLMFWDMRRSKRADPGPLQPAQQADRDSRVA